MKRTLGVLAGVLLLVVLGGAAVVMRSRQTSTPILSSIVARPEVRAPEGVRIRVQVLNTTTERGLARRATRLLRDRGFDVVDVGTTTPKIDTTIVLDLSGHPAWADAAAKVMAPAQTRVRQDSSRYLDITVLIGSTWRAPTEPLYP